MTEVLIHFWQTSMEAILAFVAGLFLLGFWTLALLMIVTLIMMPVGIIWEKIRIIWERLVQKHR